MKSILLFVILAVISISQSAEYKTFSEKLDNYSLEPIMVTRDSKSGSIYYLIEKDEYRSGYFKFRDTYLIKLNANLDSLWKRSFTEYHAVYDIINIQSNGVIVVGDSIDMYTYDHFKCLTRIDSSGRLLWNKKVPSSYGWVRVGVDVAVSDTSLILAGRGPESYLSACKVSLDSSAELIKLNVTTCSLKIAGVNDIFLNDSGSVDIFCSSVSDTSDVDITMVCLDSDLNLKQMKKLPGERKDVFQGAQPTSKGSYLMWGQTNSSFPYGSTAYFGQTNYFISETSNESSNYLKWFKCSKSTSLNVGGVLQSNDKWIVYLRQGVGIARMYIDNKGDSLEYKVLTPSTYVTLSGAVPLSADKALLYGEKTLGANKYGSWIAIIGNDGDLPIELTSVKKVFPAQKQLHNFNIDRKYEQYLLSGKKVFSGGSNLNVGPASSIIINNRKKEIRLNNTAVIKQ
jgi:hypothetical protein